jgi:hypothetical protein
MVYRPQGIMSVMSVMLARQVTDRVSLRVLVEDDS